MLDAPEYDRVAAPGEKLRRSRGVDRSARDAYAGGYTDPDDDAEADGSFSTARARGFRFRLSGGVVPRSLWGRIAAGIGLAVLVGLGLAGVAVTQNYFLKDEHFVVPNDSAIETGGNARIPRAQLLDVFGADIERNIFKIPLDQRRIQLEELPWVEHATVMRLLPDRIRVEVKERTPVAFVRRGAKIGLVDGSGVLLDMPAREASGSTPQYSFPVLTGIAPEDPQSTRAARMKIYMEFVHALDATGDKISERLSEVDLSNPEDVKAIVPDDSGTAGAGADVLVHFGAEKFLERYRQFEQYLPEWRTQYPKLASADMRYERQVVLEMKAGSSVPIDGPSPDGGAAKAAAKPEAKAGSKAGTGVVAKKAGAPPVAKAVAVQSASAGAAKKAPAPFVPLTEPFVPKPKPAVAPRPASSGAPR